MEHMKTDEIPNHLDSPKPSENSFCRKCRYYYEEYNICGAFFPKKIPLKYLSGKEKHTAPDEGQKNHFVYKLDPKFTAY